MTAVIFADTIIYACPCPVFDDHVTFVIQPARTIAMLNNPQNHGKQ